MPPERPELRLGEGARAAILEEARRRYPEECCGGLLGRVDDERGVRTVVRVEAVRNERRERRERRYLVGPREVMRLEDRAEEEGLELFGFFHSHPDHPARPSEHDRRAAWPWYSYVIVSVREGDPERIRSWRLTDDRGSFDEERVTATEGATDEP